MSADMTALKKAGSPRMAAFVMVLNVLLVTLQELLDEVNTKSPLSHTHTGYVTAASLATTLTGYLSVTTASSTYQIKIVAATAPANIAPGPAAPYTNTLLSSLGLLDGAKIATAMNGIAARVTALETALQAHRTILINQGIEKN